MEHINISISSASLQPFTNDQWKTNQQIAINNVRRLDILKDRKKNEFIQSQEYGPKLANKSMQERKRAATLHITDVDGMRLRGATVVVEQVFQHFPLGSAIAKTILGNLRYQVSSGFME